MPGQYHDSETGLHYNWFRYYDPATGRYNSPDPIGYFGSATDYAYAANNPLYYVDPTGRIGVAGAAIGAGIGAISGYFASGGTWQGALTGAVIGGTAGFLGQFGASWEAGALIGAVVGMGENLAWQLAVEGRSWACVDGDQVFWSGVLGGLTGGIGGKLSARTAASKRGVWELDPKIRGSAIESQLAKTDYKDWFNVGQLDKGKFPLVDFQKGNNLVSLKSVYTTGGTSLGRMQEHIVDLASRGATVNGKAANMILDLRVQPGGAAAAQSLVDFGLKRGVTVIVKEF
jgi:RHS repeat-associated protein